MNSGKVVNFGVNVRCPECGRIEEMSYGDYVKLLTNKGWSFIEQTGKTILQKPGFKPDVPTWFKGTARCPYCGEMGGANIKHRKVEVACTKCHRAALTNYDYYVKLLINKGWSFT